jgi:hypothetical protein
MACRRITYKNCQNLLRLREWHVRDVLECIIEWRYNERIIKRKRALHKIESDTAGIDDDIPGHGASVWVDYCCGKGFAEQTEDITLCHEWLAAQAPS